MASSSLRTCVVRSAGPAAIPCASSFAAASLAASSASSAACALAEGEPAGIAAAAGVPAAAPAAAPSVASATTSPVVALASATAPSVAATASTVAGSAAGAAATERLTKLLVNDEDTSLMSGAIPPLVATAVCALVLSRTREAMAAAAWQRVICGEGGGHERSSEVLSAAVGVISEWWAAANSRQAGSHQAVT